MKLVDKLGFDKDKFVADFQSEVTLKEIEDELKIAYDKKIDSTPTMYINGDEVVGVKPYFELKDILIKHGAKPRK